MEKLKHINPIVWANIVVMVLIIGFWNAYSTELKDMARELLLFPVVTLPLLAIVTIHKYLENYKR